MRRRLALAPLLVALALAAVGVLYAVHALAVPGPRVAEALPLDELSRHDAAPLLVYVCVWALPGVLLAYATRWARLGRLTAALALALGTVGLLELADTASLTVTRQIAARDALDASARLGAVYLAAGVVGLAVAALGRSRARGRREPVLVAVAAAFVGALQLVHALLPGESRELAHSLLPAVVGPLARATWASTGLALLFAARGLARRRRRAWQVAVVLVALSALAHVVHGLRPGAMIAILLLILLVARRQDFLLPGDEQTRFLIGRRLALAAAGIWGYAFVTLWVNRLDADQPFTLGFVWRETLAGVVGLHTHGSPHLTGSFGQWFPLSLMLMGLGATAWVVGGWLAPWRHRVRQEVRERRLARELVRDFGTDTLAPFALRSDKSYFFAEDGSAFLAYRVVGGVAIVAGDPIGPSDAFRALVERFVAHAHARDWRIAILGASGRFLDLYREHGFHALYHGDEAVVETAAFNLDGRPIRKVRQSVHRLAKAGYCARVLAPSEVEPGLRDELEAIAAAWRGEQPERGFAMALDALFALGDDDAVFVAGFDPDGRPCGFLHFAVAPAISALSLSSMPRLRSATPNGFNEWLICEAIAWARDRGYQRVSLNFSPFAALLAPEAQLSGLQELQRLALMRLKGHFQLDNLLAFNRKFFPEWETRFVVYERRLDLPRVSLAALAAEAYLPFQR